MKVGEDDDGYKVKMKLKHFLKYVRNGGQADDSPLYIFDSNFDTDPVSKALLDDYRPPQKYFPDDLFALVGEKRRPPYRWFLVGPERSGTTVHIDPLGTSAWNTVLQGRKRWVLFPPGTPKDTVKCLSVIRKGEDDEAVNYFVDLLPRLKRSAHPPAGMIEFTQMPGDTVFIPGGWWHAVLNLDDTIAVTQNFCSRVAFDRVWRKTRSGRRKMAIKWRKLLKQDYPELVQWSERIDEEDEFNITLRPEKKHKKEA
jgi:histone arginine demethylase JMJD6